MRTPLPFSALAWTPDLAGALAEASAAIARLDARICASSFGSAWRLRASWTGYATALRCERTKKAALPAQSAAFM